MTHSKWRRVSRGYPCPICGRPDWCAVASDDAAALCQRVESSKRIKDAGWLHRLRDDGWRPIGSAVRFVSLSTPATTAFAALGVLTEQYRAAVDPDRLQQHANSLGLSAGSLRRLNIGWSVDRRAWSFPMRNADGNVLGIRLRLSNGAKFAVKGGKDGLFLPAANGSDRSGPLLICEGPTDTAALLDMGFVDVAGRPSCTGGIKLLVNLIRRCPREVIVVSDGDVPGRRGADNLASVLVAYAPSVRVIAPADGIKDARAWRQAGADRKDVEKMINAAVVRRLAVRARLCDGKRR
jgi:DNA primase